jgi:hypothetical protein
MDAYKTKWKLVETIDPEIDKPVSRRPGFEGIKTLGEIDESIAQFIRKAREDKDLTRAELAPLPGLSMQVYGRCERAFSKMQVTRMIHLCESSGSCRRKCCSALPRIYGAHAGGSARHHGTCTTGHVSTAGTKRDLLALVKKMVALERAADGAAAEPQKGDASGIHGTADRIADRLLGTHACTHANAGSWTFPGSNRPSA